MKHYFYTFIMASALVLFVSCDSTFDKYEDCKNQGIGKILTCKDAKWKVSILRDSSFTFRGNGSFWWFYSTRNTPPHELKQDIWIFTKDHKVQTTLWGKVDWEEIPLDNSVKVNGVSYEVVGGLQGSRIDNTLFNEIKITEANNDTRSERTTIQLAK